MSNILSRIEKLSPKQRKLLELKKAEKLKIPPLQRANTSSRLPLSFAQQRLWFLHHLKPESALYNVPVALRIRGKFDTRVLQQAVNEIVRRHEVLRTTYRMEDGEIWQEIGPAESVLVFWDDLTILDAQERELKTEQLVNEEAQKPFDLAHGPLLRIKVLKLGELEHAVEATMHHIVSDGWSKAIFIREFAALYQAFSQGEVSPLAELPVQYADYVLWQRTLLKGEFLNQQLKYWQQQLSGLETLDLPTDYARPVTMSDKGASIKLTFDEALTMRLKQFSQAEGATPFMVLLAAFQILMKIYAGQHDIAVGTPIANRRKIETEALIGFFVNTLVLRSNLGGNPSFREVLQRVRQVTLGAYQHQDVPFEKIVEELHPDRHLSRSPLFQVMMTLQNIEAPQMEIAGLQVVPYNLEFSVAKFDLLLALSESTHGLIGEISYALDLFVPETIHRLVKHFELVLEEMVRDPEQRIGELCLLGEEEKQQVLVEWNRTEREYPSRTIHELFAGQAERTPEAIAVVCGGEKLSYEELNARANQLGHYLRQQGVGPEVRVAVCLERSVEMVAALLAVLKAGGAYVPLDPAYPQERLRFMVEDSEAAVLLTESRFAQQFANTAIRVLVMDEERKQIELESSAELSSTTAAAESWPM